MIAESARAQFSRLNARWKATIIAGMHAHLEHEPRRESKSRIKRLRGLRKAQYRLRIDSMRLFYDVDDNAGRVEVLGIVDKDEASRWILSHGEDLI